MAAQIHSIIFDLGNVLISWDPKRVYNQVFQNDSKKVDWFLTEVCSMDWNENQDAGYPLEQATADRVALFPQYEEWIRMYYGRWEEMLGGAIEPTVEILREIKATGKYRVVALTNWSAETFPIALEKFEFLSWFEGIVVSGEEQTRKPFADIYDICLNRFELQAQNSLFIDDNARNIEAAQTMGLQTHLFKDAKDLRADLVERKVLS